MTDVFADLHLHSSASDGELEPRELVRQAARAGLRAMALTDHDTLAGIPDALDEASGAGIELIPGCELSAYMGEQELHILALFINWRDDTSLKSLIETGRMKRPARVLEMGAKLRKLGISLSDDDITAAAAAANSPGRTHVADALLKKGFVSSVSEAFQKYLNPGAAGYVPKLRFRPEEIIAAIRDAGGVAILAHPGHYPDFAAKSCDMMDGLEALHSSHSMAERSQFKTLARQLGRLVSGGSDFHGPRIKPYIAIGCSGVNREDLELLRAKSNTRSNSVK
ncbi:MAG: hypothetical protein A2X94_02375 [Bdellovibrionales bacterium GWB1_55_8]|nr:MAG: hypothetical protein A2X94_02375 [Bdellovibrionales bacterium GWB1_55_8]